MRSLELLAPAKDKNSGIAAIDCGADAVYIGALKFGARAAAGNSLDDIAHLTDYAHRFQAKVYVTLNTILYDDELDEMRSLCEELKALEVDAFLVQDMAMLPLTEGSGIPLHASTQMENRSIDKIGWLKELGFTRAVLARELSLEEIQAIHTAHPDIELEVFVHGALCVSRSGLCYASQHFFGRSANRGECAQFCRMKFDLIDSDGTIIQHNSHLLSLKDLSLINDLEALAAAGVTSFKIEGRLKDSAYVKNVVSAYSQQLDRLCAKKKDEYQRSSRGIVEHSFTPDINKTFHRGYTDYFLHGRQRDIASPHTPKVMGEKVGIVKELRQNHILISSVAAFANGDGLCFINDNNTLEGFRVNRAEGNRLFPFQMPTTLRRGMELYRNNDVAFEKVLAKCVATRRIPIHLTFATTPDGFSLRAEGDSEPVEVAVTFAHQPAQKAQEANIRKQLGRWGDTIYKVENITIADKADQFFIPSSILSTLRQTLNNHLAGLKRSFNNLKTPRRDSQNAVLTTSKRPEEISNVSNRISKDLYQRWNMPDVQVPLEVDAAHFSEPLMQCKHCLRYALGYCTKHGGMSPTWHEPLFLRLTDGRRARLSFDCERCQMNVWQAKTPLTPS